MKNKIVLCAFLIFNFIQAGAQTISTVAGNGILGLTGDGGAATAAESGVVARVAFDTTGNIYFGDYTNNVVRKINIATGIITTVAGNGTAGFSGDSGLATSAALNGPQGLAVDIYGNLYIADVYNNRVRKVDTSGIITTIAGVGTSGVLGDGGPATDALIEYPYAIAIDKYHNIYIAGFIENRIRKIDTFGIIHTIAGNGTGGFSGDGGPASAAELFNPIDIRFDTAGNLYIADFNNYRIREITTDGIMHTIAGNGTRGFAGDGGAATDAEFNDVESVCADNTGNIFVTDGVNSRVRRITPAHGSTPAIISTYAGNGGIGYGGDGGPAIDATLDVPNGVAVDRWDDVYVGDNGNYRLRKISAFIVGRSHICVGDTTTFTCALPGGAWSSTDTLIATVGATSGIVTGIAPGTVTISYAFGLNIATMPITVDTMYPGYAGTILGIDSVCIGCMVTLTDTVAGGTWTATNNLALDSAGFITGVAGGIDTILYIVSNSCGSDTSVFPIKVEDFPTMVSNVAPGTNKTPGDLHVFPNPLYANDELKVEINNPLAEPIEINIYNSMGMRIKVIHSNATTGFSILADFPPGSYVMNVSTSKGVFNKPFVALGGN